MVAASIASHAACRPTARPAPRRPGTRPMSRPQRPRPRATSDRSGILTPPYPSQALQVLGRGRAAGAPAHPALARGRDVAGRSPRLATRPCLGGAPAAGVGGKPQGWPAQAAGGEAGAAGGTIRREVLTRQERTKLDAGDDREFYSFPRLCFHVDDKFLAQLTQLYRERVPMDGEVLDIMSSWVSHLPPEANYKRVVGHGMNAAELLKNPQLNTFFVRDLNADPGLEADDESFDAVVCCVSVQYLTQPEAVFAEIYRVLKPGGVCIIAFSNRMFYQKAISAWRDGGGFSRVGLVKQYFQCVTGFTEPEVVTEVGGGETDGTLWGRLMRLLVRSAGDPFYAVVSYRNFKRVDV